MLKLNNKSPSPVKFRKSERSEKLLVEKLVIEKK